MMAIGHDFKAFPELTNSQMQFYYFQSPHKQITEDFEGRVERVIDGDTIRVSTKFRDFETVVRLIDIAAPELGEKGGLESKKWLEQFILGKDIQIGINKKNRVGKWGRIIGRVMWAGWDVNEMSKIEQQSIGFGVTESHVIRSIDKKLKRFEIGSNYSFYYM